MSVRVRPFALLCLGLLLVSAVWFSGIGLSAQQPAQEQDAGAAGLLAQAARAAYLEAINDHRQGTGGGVEEVYRWSHRWQQADGSPEAAASHHERMQALLNEVQARADIGAEGGSAAEVAAARYYVLEAKQLARP